MKHRARVHATSLKLTCRCSGHADTDLMATASARLSMNLSLFSSTKPKNFFMGAGVEEAMIASDA